MVFLLLLASCSDDSGGTNQTASSPTPSTTTPSVATTAKASQTTVSGPATSTTMPFTFPGRQPLAGMPVNTDPKNIYANALSGLSDAVKNAKNLVYVPHNDSADVWVIDPTTYKVIDKFPTGAIAQHVV
ncbi:MAG: hypothetical protein F2692_12085, partial [Actinobacteria bacterium]|nr:hypothetical protein [Actinomycetota bacterium]